MKKRQRIKSKVGLGLLLLAALALAMVPTGAKAQDTDFDGFTDEEETLGIFDANNVLLFPGLESQALRVNRLDPATPDLFVILVPGKDQDGNFFSNFPANPLEFVHKPRLNGGLGIVTHEIPYAEANLYRYVFPDSVPNCPQKAVRITEDLHPEGIILGYANQGTPNDLDDAIIYTEHIKSHVNSVYAEVVADGYPIPAEDFIKENVIIPYIKHTIAHEIGHMTSLAVDYNRRFGGYHYKSGSEVIMEQAVVYTEKKGVVTFYISTEYAQPSQDGLLLK